MIYTDLYSSDLIKVQENIPNLNTLRDSSIFVTGATGLIGSCIVDFLIYLNDTLNSNNVIYLGATSKESVVNRFEKNADRLDVVFVKYDALKPVQITEKFDYIIHTASPASPELYVSKPVETMLCNIMGLNSLLEYAYKNETKKVLYVSSSEVYGMKSDNKPFIINEYGYLDLHGQRSSYPSAKRAAETLCSSYLNEYNLDVMIVRPGHIYGPTAKISDKRASSQFFRDVINGNDIIMKSPGNQLRSYCYVVDCVSAMIAVLLNGKPCFPYNIANNKSNITIRQLAELIAECSGRKVVFNNPSGSEVIAFNMMDNSCLDSSDLENLGWKSEFDGYSGVKHTYSIMNANAF